MRALLLVFALLAVVGAGLALLVGSYTSGKLERGRMVRGEIPGAKRFPGEVIAVRGVPGAIPEQCEVLVDVVVDGERQDSREWANEPVCSELRVGDRVELARPAGDDELYLPNGTWASRGNEAFDEMLLVVERTVASVLGVIAIVLGVLGLRVRRRRAA